MIFFQVRAVVHAPRPFSAVDSPVHFVVYADELMAWLDDLESCLTASLVVGEAQSITDCLNKIKASSVFVFGSWSLTGEVRSLSGNGK